MIKTICFILCLVILGLSLAGCTKQEVLASVVAKKLDGVTMSNNMFAWHLFRLINADDKVSNVFISPLSVTMAVSMVLNGAEGSTSEAIKKALYYEGFDMSAINAGNKYLSGRLTSSEKNITLDIANAIWIQDGFPVKKTFVDINRDMFDALVANIDFNKKEAAETINKWIGKATKGLIDKMVEPPTPEDMVMYLVNAIYFKGEWTEAFDPKMTFEMVFNGKKKTNVQMMSKSGKIDFYQTEKLKAVRLPYGKDKAVSMYVMLPNSNTAIDTFIQEFDMDRWAEIREGMESRQEVKLCLPKFKIEYGAKELRDTLTLLGMGVAFSDEADFSGISDRSMTIDTVMHKAVIEVDEIGSKAAAVTGIGMKATALVETPEFIADRPFIFVISDDVDDSILFMGKMIE